MTEAAVGDCIRFKESGHHRIGVVKALIMAGRAKGTGIWALRQRARILFEADGRRLETHRDLDALTIVACDTQFELFDQETVEG